MRKKILLFLLLCCSVTQLLAWELVKDGLAQADIVIPQNPRSVEKYAAEELAYIIEKASGCRLAIVDSRQANKDRKKILLGRAAKLELADLPLCGFRILSSADSLALAGRDGAGEVEKLRTAAGTLFAVYEWAERELGVRWLWPDELGELIPTKETIESGSYDLSWEPPLQFAYVRRYDWRWNRRMLRADTSKYIRFAGCPSQGHAFINWYKVYGPQHPEYFEMDSQGRRLNDRYASMCVSNPAFHQQIIDNWRDSGYTKLAVNAKENDAYGRCQCDQCKAWDGGDWRWPSMLYASQRNVGERYAKFYKRLWEMAAEINPEVQVGAYAYMNYVYAPRNTKLNKNIVVGFVDDLPFPRTEKYQQLVEDEIKAWGDSGASLYMRPNFMLSSYAMPELFYHQYAQQFKLAYNNGMLGLDIDGPNLSWATLGPNLYVMNRLVVDPQRPVSELLQEYCSGFGAGAEAMRRYFDYWEKYCMDNAEHFNQVHETKSERKWFIFGNFYTGIAHLLFPDKVFEPALKFLEEAELKAKGEPDAAQRVAFIRQGYEHARLCAQSSAIFANQNNDNLVRQRTLQVVKDFREQIPALAADLKRFTRGGVLEAHAWKLLDMSLENSTALPETWKLKIAGSTEGRELGYFQADFNDTDWKPISTWSFLEDQDVLEYNFAWYRTKVELPETQAGQKVILRLGAVDESGWFWVNGKEAGSLVYDSKVNPNSWKEPQEYDVTELVKFGQDNQITALVENKSGKGGLWRPSFIRYERIGSGNVMAVDFPAPRAYASKEIENGEMALKIIGRPDLGKENSWLKSIVALPVEEPGGKTFRLKGDIVAENLGKGEFWLVLRHVSAAGKTLTYSGIIIKEDCDWNQFQSDLKIRREAKSIAVFAVGVNMPEGSNARVKNVTVEEMR
ncbi:MAG: DUF4838 domain-containing protein [Lentisphaeria bacterium]|nr:DUF4838 domain-containing protein [Lentisphaeria bacterium]NLZ59442.1 DUF4838 domain-containing protein [Lentisphaerota bacterium]